MKINFKGVNYISSDKKVNSGQTSREEDSVELTVTAKLTDDESGNDLSDFKNRMKMCRPCYQVNCVNRNNPDVIQLYIKSRDEKINDNIDSIQLNNYELMLDEDQILPLFTFLARITKDGSQNTGFLANLRQDLEFLNKSISKEVAKYINK